MIEYLELINKLKTLSDENYKKFHSKLLKNENVKLLGVRTPDIRKTARELISENLDNLFSFPDEYYEITLIKLICLSQCKMAFSQKLAYLDRAVLLINNWATCDLFDFKDIKKHKAEFIPKINEYLSSGKEFVERFALVSLLAFYKEEGDLPLIFESVKKADREYYYVYMACAWLVAEVLVKHYDKGIEFLKSGVLDVKTQNKAIQKAKESYRITDFQKKELESLKKSNKNLWFFI